MIGFLIGTACTLGLAKMLIHHRHHGAHFHRNHHRFHRAHFGEHGDVGPPERPEGPRAFRFARFRQLFQELDATPAQEREVREVVRELIKDAGALRAGVHEELATGVAEALEQDGDPQVALDALFAQQDERIVEARAALSLAVSRMQDALDSEQRSTLASWLGKNKTTADWGPYR